MSTTRRSTGVRRVKAAAHGGQVLATKTTRDLVEGRLGGGFGLKRLGEFRLRDLAGPELIYQLTHADLPAGFPPIRTGAERVARARCRWAPPRWSGGSRPSASWPACSPGRGCG